MIAYLNIIAKLLEEGLKAANAYFNDHGMGENCVATGSEQTGSAGSTSSQCGSFVGQNLKRKNEGEVSEQKSKRAKLFADFNKKPILSVFNSQGQDQSRPNIIMRLNQAVEDLLQGDEWQDSDLTMYSRNQFEVLKPLAKQLLSAPVSSASSERVFSQAGLIMKPTRSRLSKELLSQLVFLKCNSNLL